MANAVGLEKTSNDKGTWPKDGLAQEGGGEASVNVASHAKARMIAAIRPTRTADGKVNVAFHGAVSELQGARPEIPNPLGSCWSFP